MAVNIKLLLTLGLLIASAFMMRDTISTGMGLMTGRFEVVPVPPSPEAVEAEEDAQWLAFKAKSDERIHHWYMCTFTHYREENTNDCGTETGYPVPESEHR